MPHAQGVNVGTITSRRTREPRKLSATASAVSFTSPDYAALGISPQATPACRESTAFHPRPTRKVFRDFRTQQPTSEIYTTLRPDRDCKTQHNLQTAQPSPRAHRNAPSTAISTPSTQPRNSSPPRGSTTVHPRPGLPPLRPLFRHPTAAEGAALCTLNSNCTAQPTRTAAQPPPRANKTAPSTPIRASGTNPATANRPEGTQKCTLNQEHPALPLPQPHNHQRGRKEVRPRPRLAPSPATPICPEGAQQCTLDRVCPHSGRCSVTQLPPKVQHCAHSIAIARHNPPARQHNRHRGRKEVHPRPQIAQR